MNIKWELKRYNTASDTYQIDEYYPIVNDNKLDDQKYYIIVKRGKCIPGGIWCTGWFNEMDICESADLNTVKNAMEKLFMDFIITEGGIPGC